MYASGIIHNNKNATVAGCSALEIGANHPGSNRPVLPLKKGTMHSTDTKSQFIELRAKNWSLARIATLISFNNLQPRKKLHSFCLTFAS